MLLLTTDGKLSEQIRTETIEKEYYVEAAGKITLEAIEQLKKRVEISIYGKKLKTGSKPTIQLHDNLINNLVCKKITEKQGGFSEELNSFINPYKGSSAFQS